MRVMEILTNNVFISNSARITQFLQVAVVIIHHRCDPKPGQGTHPQKSKECYVRGRYIRGRIRVRMLNQIHGRCKTDSAWTAERILCDGWKFYSFCRYLFSIYSNTPPTVKEIFSFLYLYIYCQIIFLCSLYFIIPILCPKL
jgi:hypothetical protein